MILFLRTLLFGLPAAFVLLTWWAADQVRVSRSLRQGDLVVLMSQPTIPAMNPYLPATEAERQLVNLVHEPLLKIGADGKLALALALASDWRWMKRVTVWFAQPEAALEARKRLHEARGPRWTTWKLESAEAIERSLVLTFTDPMLGDARAALQAAAAKVQRIQVLRVEAKNNARAAHRSMMATPELAKPVKRVWLDGDDAFEIAVTGLGDDTDYEQALRQHLEKALPSSAAPTIQVKAVLPMLEEPVLEFTLREARWHDGTPVTATDVKATFEALSATAWPLPNGEGLRIVRGVEVIAPNRVQVLLWRHYGPAMCAWIGLPILPAAWLKTHPLDEAGRVFQRDLAPGAGVCRVEHRDYSSLVVRPVAADSKSVRRLTMVTDLSTFTMQLGYTTRTLDLFWPSAPLLPKATLHSEPLDQRASPPQRGVQVLWNSHRSPMDDLRVREALASATDRATLIASALSGKGRSQTSLFAPGLWLSGSKGAASDAQQAEHLLSDAGWLRNVQGLAARPSGTMMLTMLVPAEDPILIRIATELRVQWLKVGVQAVVKPLSRAALLRRVSAGDFDAVVEEMPLLTSWDLWPQWHSGEKSNRCGFSNRQVDLLLEALSREFQPAEAAPRAQKAEALILAEHPVLPLLTIHEEATGRASLTVGSDPHQPWTVADLLVPDRKP